MTWSLDKVQIPFGFSHFPYEIAAPPRSWVEATGKVSFFRNHDHVSLQDIFNPFLPPNYLKQWLICGSFLHSTGRPLCSLGGA